MQFITDRFRRYDLLFLVLAVVTVVLYVGTANGGFPLDDSWIHQVYGRNLAQTGLWAFVPGVPSAASTSPLYTVLLAMGYKLSIPYKLWTVVLGIAALWVTAMVGARLAERLMPRQAYAGLLSGLALVLTWHLIWAASSGMETLLFCMWTLLLIGLSWRELDERSSYWRDVSLRGLLFGVCTALATLTRPEGIALAGLIALVMLLIRPQGSWRGLFLWGIGVAVGFMVVISPYLLLNLQLTGGLLPDTASAKQAENAPLLAVSYPGRIVNMLFPLIAGAQLLLIPGILYFVFRALAKLRNNHRALFEFIPFLWAAGLVALYAARLPAPYQHGRYVIPALPSLILIGIVGTVDLVRWSRASLAGRVLSRSLAIAAGLAFLYFAFIAGPATYRQDVRIIDEEMVASAHWISEHIPARSIVGGTRHWCSGLLRPAPHSGFSRTG